jgi:hypothetical protein
LGTGCHQAQTWDIVEAGLEDKASRCQGYANKYYIGANDEMTAILNKGIIVILLRENFLLTKVVP